MSANTLITPTQLTQVAHQRIAEFQVQVADIPYERKGILFSEMFFFWLLASRLKQRRILESGRARGQSTLILSHCFPEAEIISIEYDRNSPDVTVAAERLRGRSNVKQLFGDATRLLPKMAQPGDVALIDGPKGYRGLRLALRLLSGGRIPLVFVHDTAAGSLERRYLTDNLPESLYSDLPSIAEISHHLDQGSWEQLPEAHRWTDAGAPPAGYGFSLACLPHRPGRAYHRLLLSVILEGLRQRLLKF